MKILVINGPNLNMLGIREPDIYGKDSYESLVSRMSEYAENIGIGVEIYQSNHEGAIVDRIQQAFFEQVDGIIINPAAYTHTSVAILDALKAVKIPTVEVHLSAVETRESFRQISYVREAAIETITGRGIDGYFLAMDVLMEHVGKTEN